MTQQEIILNQNKTIKKLEAERLELIELVRKWEKFDFILRERGFITPSKLIFEVGGNE